MKWFAIVFIAIIVETITENVKNAFPAFAAKKWAVMLTTVALGVLTAFAVQADVITAVGLQSQIPYLGYILTGVLAAGGSNYVYDLIAKLKDGAVVAEAVDTPIIDEEMADFDEAEQPEVEG